VAVGDKLNLSSTFCFIVLLVDKSEPFNLSNRSKLLVIFDQCLCFKRKTLTSLFWSSLIVYLSLLLPYFDTKSLG